MFNINILYEDDQMMVIDKPAGLVVTPSESNKNETLQEILEDQFKVKATRGGIVHRLDKDTSGVLLVGKTDEIVEALQNQFRDRIVKKKYIALSHGLIEKEGIVEGEIDRNPRNREKFVVLEGGRDAVTRYKPVEHYELKEEIKRVFFEGFNKIQMRKLERSNYGVFTLVHCFPLTGRTHQIRVHLKYIGFPIVGDIKYAGRKTSRLDSRWCPRQFLHAARIEFKHPVSEETMVLESPMPKDLLQVLELLEDLKA